MIKKRVLFVSHSASLYGAERSLLDLLRKIAHEIDIYVVTPTVGALTVELSKEHIPYSVIPFINWSGTRLLPLRRIAGYLLNILAVGRLVVLCRSLKVSCIYTNTITVDVGYRAACKLRVPHCWHVREFIGKNEAANFCVPEKKIKRTISDKRNFFIFNSNSVREYYSNIYCINHAEVIYNGIVHGKSQKFTNKNAPIESILVAGSINWHKNQEEALYIIAALRAKGLILPLVLAGDGNRKYMHFLKKVTARLGIQDIVRFAGYSYQISSELNKNYCVLLCSKKESFGRILVEAMAAGKPVISTKNGGCTEIITHEKNGLLYDCGNIQQAVYGITRYVEDSSFRKKITDQAREYVISKFSINQYQHSCIRSINKVCGFNTQKK